MGTEATSGGVRSLFCHVTLLPVPLKTSFLFLVLMKVPTLVTKDQQQVNRRKNKNRDLMCIKLFLFLGKRYVNPLPLGSSLKFDGIYARDYSQDRHKRYDRERKCRNAREGSCYVWLRGNGTFQVILKVWQRERQPEERVYGQVLLAGRQVGEGTASML